MILFRGRKQYRIWAPRGPKLKALCSPGAAEGPLQPSAGPRVASALPSGRWPGCRATEAGRSLTGKVWKGLQAWSRREGVAVPGLRRGNACAFRIPRGSARPQVTGLH